jgi:hypothetical protein
MIKSEIVRMAEEAGMMCDENVWFSKNRFHIDVDMADLERFATLVAAAEREKCAKICEDDSWKVAATLIRERDAL